LLSLDHDDFEYELIQQEADLIVDTQGRFCHFEKVIKA